jgi:hypothetical protein
MDTSRQQRPEPMTLSQRLLQAGPSIILTILFIVNLIEYFAQDEAKNWTTINFNILAAWHLFWLRYAGY